MSGTTFSKLPVMIVALVIGLILTFTAVMPLVSDYSDAKTFKNEGYYDLTYTETENVTMEWDYTSPTNLTLNGKTIQLPDVVAGSPRTILCGDDWVIRWVKLNSGYYGLDYYTDGDTFGASEGGQSVWSIVAEDGTLTITNQNSVTKTNTYTYLYCIAEDGPLIMKESNKPAYIMKDSTVYAMGNTTNVWSGASVYLKITGTVEDGFTATVFGYTGDNAVTVKDIQTNYEKVNGYTDLYTISSFVVTVNNGSTDATITYSYFIVPEEVTAATDNPAAYKNLVSVLPLFALILLVAGAASLVYFKNKD